MSGTSEQTNGTNGHTETMPLGRYLWTRIKHIGISRVFGVPGDFNLTLLDHVYDVDGLEWVGNTNELNAAYAADGYSRVKHGAGCLVTTHGVGELSALNAIAGSMTEQVKVIHVVGQTSRRMQENKMMIHHSIGFEPDHQMFNKASTAFRVAAAELQSEKGAAEEIDRVLRECFVKSGPVYIFVPIDLVDLPVSSVALKTPLDLSPPRDKKAVEAAAEATLEAIYASQNPAFLVDCLVDRHDSINELKTLLDKVPFPIYSTNMSKGLIDESHPNYVGLSNGIPSRIGVSASIKASDLVINFGLLPSDTNSGGFTRNIPRDRSIDLNPHTVNIKGDKIFSDTPLKAIIQSIIDKVDKSRLPSVKKLSLPERPLEDDHDATHITQSWIWHQLASFLEPHDVVLGETGTAAFGMPDATYPDSTQWHTQTYYGSIGYATPAAFGADVALAEMAAASSRPRGRTVLVTGDGSLMLTVQEIGNMVKQKASPVIFLINNAGYTIERVIHGAKQSYNDIVPFDYSKMLPFFNMPDEQAKASFHRAETKKELEEILKLDRVKKPDGGPQIVEIIMDAMDVPWRLATQIATRGPEAVKEMKEAGFKVREMEHGAGFWS
nr:hypothetical protein B0A51_12705 [Rachicladosporium sp. CCFEE 5018]